MSRVYGSESAQDRVAVAGDGGPPGEKRGLRTP